MAAVDPNTGVNTGAISLDLLARARTGDAEARNTMVRDYVPFVLRCASRVAGRYVRRGEDDEVSIALMAFNEAIDRYDERQQPGFLRFAEMVIRRRLIDHYRKERTRAATISLNDSEGVAGRMVNDTQQPVEIIEHRDEIDRLSLLLGQYGLTLASVARSCPRHRDARSRTQAIARMIVADERLRDHLIRNRTLPCELVARMAGTSRRTIERNREYITAVCLILLGEFPLVSGYVCGP